MGMTIDCASNTATYITKAISELDRVIEVFRKYNTELNIKYDCFWNADIGAMSDMIARLIDARNRLQKINSLKEAKDGENNY